MARKPDTPCAGCGKLLWGGSTSLPDGQRRCRDCRHSYKNGCRCDACRTVNTTEHREYVARRRAEGRPLKRYGSSGPWINPKVRDEVFERDNWTCRICNELLDRDAEPNSDWYPSIDHIVPYSKGGRHTADNLRAAHRWCNSIRGAEDHHADLFEVA